MRLLPSLVILLIISLVNGDIYLHSPPGSNDRNQETSENRNNANRLFNSQNNAAGGYCRGGALEWYESSYLPLQWTNQHGCGSDETECNVVIQYMCTDSTTAADGEYIRDGTVTNTISDTNVTQLSEKDGNDYKYGLHEPSDYYQRCIGRERNKGLFTANLLNMNDNNRGADKTRQNQNANRYGFECSEERDYYPYWAPSPWKDVAIITDNRDLCSYYKKESQNVKSRWYCAGSDTTKKYSLDPAICAQQGGVWTEQPAYDIDEPQCLKAEWTSVNSLGNTLNGPAPPMFNWSLPNADMEPCIGKGSCQCVVRVRYNISTSDIKGYGKNFTDYKSNGPNGPTNEEDPNVQIAKGQNVTLNINPNQYGRTFQDRSHVFRILKRPSNLKGAKIWNLLVKGKRGNIVQTYPAHEYMFVPHNLEIKINEYIHFQWTGCDYNPTNYDGSGIKGTDRSNMVQIESLNHNHPMKESDLNSDNALFRDEDTRLYFALQNQVTCKSYADLLATNNNNDDQVEVDPQNCMYLNAAPTRFDGGVHKMTKTGSFYYMSTRNNNFSNRNQKGAIHVSPLLAGWQIGLIAAGCSLFVVLSAFSGTVAFAKFHPHSGANSALSKIPGVRALVN